MESFNQQFQSNSRLEAAWTEELKKFNTTHANDRTFTDKYSITEKNKFTQNLFSILMREFSGNITDKPSSTALLESLVALRISLREITEQDKLMALNDLNLFFKLGNIGDEEKIFVFSDEIREESLKCIVNCIARDKDIQSKFIQELNGPVVLVRELLKNSSTINENVLLVIYKILTHCSANPAIRESLKPEGLLEHVTEQLVLKTSNTTNYNAPLLSDLCRLLFTLTIHLGPLEGGKPTKPSDNDLNRYRKLLPVFKKIMTHYTPDQTSPMYSLKCALISSLLNTPKELYDELVSEIPLEYFQEIFKNQIKLLDNPMLASEFLPILMLITNIAENVIETRQPLKEMTFPYDLIKDSDEPLSVGIEPPVEAKTTGISAKLIPLMTGSDIGFKHFVSEFFFMICDEDANEVCRLTGFGNAAGLLVTRGLLSLGGQ